MAVLKTIVVLIFALFFISKVQARQRSSSDTLGLTGCKVTSQNSPCPLCATDLVFWGKNPFDSITEMGREIIDYTGTSPDLGSIAYNSTTVYNPVITNDTLGYPMINTNTSFFPTPGRQYAFCLTLKEGSLFKIDTAFFIVIANCDSIVNGIDKVSEQPHNSLSVYPNPVSETLSLNIVSLTPQMGRISIYDIAGREVMALTDNLTMSSGTNQFEYNIAPLSKGAYVVQIIYQDGYRDVKKIVKN